MSLATCNSQDNTVVKLDVTPSSAGTFKSNCQTTTINTNAPGYTLTAKVSDSNLQYLNPTTVSPTPTISPTTANIASPAVLGNDTWGFGVKDRLNFTSTYGIDDSTNTYAALPTTDTTIYQTDQFPLPETTHTFFYGTNLTTETMAGTYAATVTYTAVGEAPVPITYCGTVDEECIIFTVNTTDGTYSIPTSGRVAGMDHVYDWLVYVDDVLTTDCTNGNCTGTSSISSAGIALTGLPDGIHQIRIIPNGNDQFNSSSGSIAGWGNAFGHHINGGANVNTNKQKLISLDAPLTTMAFSPKTIESTSNASHMFAYTFYGCTNLTTPIALTDTYELPDTITSLAGFLSGTHYDNTSLTSPVDLTPLSGWFKDNTSIAYLTSFLNATHHGNTNLASPIDLTPLSGWFKDNTSIADLSYFLCYTHSDNASLKLAGQTILPNWIKTLKQGAVDIWDVSDAFYGTFRSGSGSALAGDTDEVKFEDTAQYYLVLDSQTAIDRLTQTVLGLLQ